MEIDTIAGKEITNNFEQPNNKNNSTPLKSIEGYVIVALNIHEEATEEDVEDFFEDYGKVKNLHLNLDRQSGYVKGYAFIEYATLKEAQKAVDEANGVELLGKNVAVDFAFLQPSKDLKVDEDFRISGAGSRRTRSDVGVAAASGSVGRNDRDRSRSPDRRV